MTPEVGIVFRNKDLDAFTVDLNAHVPFGFEDNKVVLYPLAGANYTSWNRHDMEDAEHNDVSTHINRFGINAGAGIELRCTKSLKLSLEGKYCFNSHYSTAQVSLGISFIF